MLVLARKIYDRFVLQTPLGEIWVQVLEPDGRHTRLGITAPPDVKVLREELVGKAKGEGGKP